MNSAASSTGCRPDASFQNTVRIPGGLPLYEVSENKLTAGWKGYPYDSLTQQTGDSLLKSGNYGIMRIPSAIVDEEWNYMISPDSAISSGICVTEEKQLYLDSRWLPDTIT